MRPARNGPFAGQGLRGVLVPAQAEPHPGPDQEAGEAAAAGVVMRLAFAGTPAFAEFALRALLEAGHDVALVLTQPDRPAGRGLRPRASEVKELALAHGLPFAQPVTLKSDQALATLQAAQVQIMVVAAYGLILPPALLDLFRFGCINIHASLLPRWRGAAPIQRAILAGDTETGISIMRMDAGLDTGPVYLKQSVRIEPNDT